MDLVTSQSGYELTRNPALYMYLFIKTYHVVKMSDILFENIVFKFITFNLNLEFPRRRTLNKGQCV